MGAGSSVKDYPFFYFTEVKKEMQEKGNLKSLNAKRMVKEILPHHPLFIFTSLVVVNENLLCCLVAQGNIPDRRGKKNRTFVRFLLLHSHFHVDADILAWT